MNNNNKNDTLRVYNIHDHKTINNQQFLGVYVVHYRNTTCPPQLALQLQMV